MIKLKKMMKKWLLSGCLLTLMACGQVPQERIDSLKETIADYEENGAGAEMPEEFRVAFCTIVFYCLCWHFND